MADVLARVRARLSGRRRQQGYVAIGLVSSFALVAGLGVAGAGASSTAVHLLSGSGWLANTSTGTVSHVNGYSGKVDATVRAGVKAGDPFTVVQRGDGAYIVDQRTGKISRIDGARQSRGPAVDPAVGGPRVQVVVGHGKTFLVDREKGVVQQVDPKTLQPDGPKASLGGPISDAVVDAHGTLWASLPGKGTAVAVGHGGRRDVKVGKPGDVVTLAAPDTGTVAVDVTAGTSTPVSAEKPAVHFRPDRSVRTADAAASGHTVVAAAGRTATVLVHDSARQVTLRCAAEQVVAHGRWAYARCGNGAVQRIDLHHDHDVSIVPGPTGGATDLIQGDGVPMANDAGGSTYVPYVDGHGTVHDKYDAAKAKAKAEKRARQARHRDRHRHRGHGGRHEQGQHRSRHHHGRQHEPKPGPTSGPSRQAPAPDPTQTATAGPPVRVPAPGPKTQPSTKSSSTPTATPTCLPGQHLTADGHCATRKPGPPPKPRNVTATPGQGQVTVSWAAASGADSYVVADSAHGQQATTKSMTQTFTGLTAGTKYCFKVQAKRGQQAGPWSGQACAKPKAAVKKPSKVRRLRQTAKTKTTVTVRWKKPADNGGAKIDHYTYQIGKRSARTTTGGTKKFANLHAGKSYTVAVTATNAAGKTSAHETITVHTKKKPKAPARVPVYRCVADNGAHIYTWVVGSSNCGSNWKSPRHVFDVVNGNAAKPAGATKLEYWNFNGSNTTYGHSVRWCRGACGYSGEWGPSNTVWAWTSAPASHVKATRIVEYKWSS